MKRFRRFMFNVLAAVSLILFLATVVLWVVSFRHAIVGGHRTSNNIALFYFADGSLGLSWTHWALLDFGESPHS